MFQSIKQKVNIYVYVILISYNTHPLCITLLSQSCYSKLLTKYSLPAFCVFKPSYVNVSRKRILKFTWTITLPCVCLQTIFENSNRLARTKCNKEEAPDLGEGADQQPIFFMQMRKSKAKLKQWKDYILFCPLFQKTLPFFIRVSQFVKKVTHCRSNRHYL